MKKQLFLNGCKTIPFGSAHTYIVHIRRYPSPSGSGSTAFLFYSLILKRARCCYSLKSLSHEIAIFQGFSQTNYLPQHACSFGN